MSTKKAIASNEVEDVMEVPLDEPPMSQVVWVKEEDSEEESSDDDNLFPEASTSTSSSPPPIRCPICSRIFETREELTEHRRMKHSDEKVHECPYCEKAYASTGTLKTHLDFHKNGGFRCETCKKVFATPYGLKKHSMSHQQDRERTFQCTLCPVAFYGKNSLKQHLEKVHTTKLEFKCKYCDEAFKYKPTMEVHEGAHFRANNFECTICTKKFATQIQLRKHTTQHQRRQEKAHECTTCGSKYAYANELKNHQKSHEQKKPDADVPPQNKTFECRHCKKVFLTIVKLRGHQKTHEEYKCRTCGSTFDQNKDLKNHRKYIHGYE